MADAKTWAKRVAAWRASGVTASAFSARAGFAPSTLRWWASRLGRREGGFVRIVTATEVPKAAVDGAIELEVAGVRVLVRAGFDRTALAEVLDVLRARSPS